MKNNRLQKAMHDSNIPKKPSPIEVAKQAAILAGNSIVKARKNKTFRIETKSSEYDLVTDADREADEIIIKTIREHFPSHQILIEETFKSSDKFDFNFPIWIIDPIDGTKNFVRGHLFVGTSIAYMDKLKLQAGVVNCPFVNELFYAVRGQGAYLNEEQIEVDNTIDLKHSLLSSPFSSSNKDKFERQLIKFKKLHSACDDTRRTGCTTIDLCNIACGRTHGYFTDGICPWDIAAGSLLVREAGGSCGSFKKNMLDSNSVYYNENFNLELPGEIYTEGYYACSKKIERELLEIIAEY